MPILLSGESMLIICVGPPGSGKTTAVNSWYAEYLSAGSTWAGVPRARLSRDGLREALGVKGDHDSNPAEIEDHITLAQHAAVLAWLEAGLDVAVDDTCQVQSTMDVWSVFARQFHRRLAVWDFRQIPLERCVRQNRWRKRVVRQDAISRVASRCSLVRLPDDAEVVLFR